MPLGKKDDKNKCPKTDKVMDYKDAFKKDDHRDNDEIDDVVKRCRPMIRKNGQLYYQRTKFLIRH